MNPFLLKLRNKETDFGFVDPMEVGEEALFNIQAQAGDTWNKFKPRIIRYGTGIAMLIIGVSAYKVIRAKKDPMGDLNKNKNEPLTLFEVDEMADDDVVIDEIEIDQGSSNSDPMSRFMKSPPPRRHRNKTRPKHKRDFKRKYGAEASGSSNEEKPFYELNGDPEGLAEKRGSKANSKSTSNEKHLGTGFLDDVTPLF